MKCPYCNYEYQEEFDDKNYEYIPIIGDEKFIELYTEHKVKIDNLKRCEHGDYNYQSKIEVNLIACPKCKIVFLDI